MANIAKATVKGTAVKGKATVKASVPTVKDNGVLDASTVKLGKAVWAAWLKGQRWIALGIREKTAKGTGTRAAMLATADYGYAQGNGRVLAMAVRQAMGLNPNVGGIDFPWMEKQHNMATITSSAAIRPDAKDGKMRLLPIVASKATVKAKVKAKLETAKRAPKNPERTNGAVTTSKMTATELAELQTASNN